MVTGKKEGMWTSRRISVSVNFWLNLPISFQNKRLLIPIKELTNLGLAGRRVGERVCLCNVMSG